MASSSSDGGGEIAFVDVETTVPLRAGQGYSLLELGVILVCPRKLVEIDSFSSLIKPNDLSLVSPTSTRCNGITREAVSNAPTFREISNQIYEILHGRVWAGHNIVRFDCVRIREAFAEIGRPAPVPKATIDSLPLLTETFGRRAGNMKMATLATYFGLGQQKHRSLDDVRMNLEVLKYCATVLFLESSFPDIFTPNSRVSPRATARCRGNGNASTEGTSLNLTGPSDMQISNHQKTVSPMNCNVAGVAGEILNLGETSSPVLEADTLNILSAIDQMKIGTSLPDAAMDERPNPDSPEEFPEPEVAASAEGCSGYAGFLDPDEVSIPSISASLVPAYRGGSKIVLLHKDVLLQLCCMNLRVRFGVSSKFMDRAGLPRLSIVVDAPPSLCHVLDTCDDLAQKLSLESGSNSEWKPLVTRGKGFYNSSTIRLNIPTIVNGATATYSTEMYQKEPSGSTQRCIFSRVDAAELNSLFVPGTALDAHFSLDVYDFQQHTGIRLVAKRLIVHYKQD